MSPAELGFNKSDRRRLASALARAADIRTYRRIQAVLLVAEGRTIREVAHITGAGLVTIYEWVHRYLKFHRVEALQEASRSGRPRAATRITATRIEQARRRDPLRLGYKTGAWTVALLAHYLSRRYGCPITARTLRRRMKQCGLLWKRPRYVYSHKDPHRAQKKGASFGG